MTDRWFDANKRPVLRDGALIGYVTQSEGIIYGWCSYLPDGGKTLPRCRHLTQERAEGWLEEIHADPAAQTDDDRYSRWNWRQRDAELARGAA